MCGAFAPPGKKTSFLAVPIFLEGKAVKAVLDTPGNEYLLDNLDVDQNSEINGKDATLLNRVVVGLLHFVRKPEVSSAFDSEFCEVTVNVSVLAAHDVAARDPGHHRHPPRRLRQGRGDAAAGA